MDRLYPSENMASAHRGSASSPACSWRSAAWRRGAPGRGPTAAGAAAAPVPQTAAARWRATSRPASSTAPTRGWRGPQRRRTSRRPPACCEYRASAGSGRGMRTESVGLRSNSTQQPRRIASFILSFFLSTTNNNNVLFLDKLCFHFPQTEGHDISFSISRSAYFNLHHMPRFCTSSSHLDDQLMNCYCRR